MSRLLLSSILQSCKFIYKRMYKKMKVVELKSLARERGIRGYSRLRKDELINLLKSAIPIPPPRGRVEILKLYRGWLGFEAIHDELLRYHHKKNYFKSLHEELISIAWHPDRWRDWCLCEDEKKEIEKLW